jgi:hypothetical protein
LFIGVKFYDESAAAAERTYGTVINQEVNVSQLIKEIKLRFTDPPCNRLLRINRNAYLLKFQSFTVDNAVQHERMFLRVCRDARNAKD